MIISRSIPVAEMVLFCSFLWLANIPVCICAPSIHPSACGHVDCFHGWDTVSSVARNFGVHVSFLGFLL